MADIELVIKIPEEVYSDIIAGHNITLQVGESLRVDDVWASDLIRNGTPLPKGHGSLIDADDIDNHIIGHVDTRSCPTIIEADKEKKNDRRRERKAFSRDRESIQMVNDKKPDYIHDGYCF